MTLHVGPLPAGDERHDEALRAAIGKQVEGGTVADGLRAYFAKLAEQGVRLVDVREVAEWLRSYGLDGPPDYVHAFLARFGGGDEG